MKNAQSALTAKDYASDQRVKWCPGCGCYSVLAQVQKNLAMQGVPPENCVFISGIGCSSRFPYYMGTYGFHTLHGRALPIATGVKLANPALSVWVITGDGDGLAIGGNHMFHALRRNVGVKIILFNNRIYGLTKGQASPTSKLGTKTKTSPYGTIERPVNPLRFAIGAEATFVARSAASDPAHLLQMLDRAAKHKGTAFIEVYLDCEVFSDGEFAGIMDPQIREDNLLRLEHGKPLVFGKNKNKGIVMENCAPKTVEFDAGKPPSTIMRHDEKAPPEHAFQLTRFAPPEFPVPVGVFRQTDELSHEEKMAELTKAAAKPGGDTLEALLSGPDAWEINPSTPKS